MLDPSLRLGCLPSRKSVPKIDWVRWVGDGWVGLGWGEVVVDEVVGELGRVAVGWVVGWVDL